MRRLLLLLPLLALPLLNGCDDTLVCDLPCPTGQTCVNNGGQETCVDTCGSTVCMAGQTCESGTCVAQSVECVGGCPGGFHCVYGNCIDNYSTSNACDPLRECRNACGLDAVCQAACEDDRSSTCATCLNTLGNCESRDSCDPSRAVPFSGCCDDEHCDCFPGRPGCGNVPACQEVYETCGEDVACLNRQRGASLACNVCLQDFDDCRDGGGACTAEFCACYPSEDCP